MNSSIVHGKVRAGRAGACALLLRSAVVAMAMAAPAFAYHHHDLQVKFQDYADDVVARNLGQGRPYFLLFSAEWCHWCHEFADHTLVREEVYDYLNAHFVNVFIDADIHTAASVKYRAKGLPFTVFLNPDGSVHFRYTGTLYGDQFIEVLREIRSNIERNVAIPGQDATVEPYESPDTLDTEDLVALGEAFRNGILENFDPAEHGVGRGEKAILPRTFLYLLERAGEAEREDAVAGVASTLKRAIEAIYDPVEGGFFRYAETRDWQVPHYEKMADLNAGAALVLYRLDRLSASPALAQAGERTAQYLRSTLYEPSQGTFLSFQEASTHYYRFGAGLRGAAPAVADKVFTDRLAGTLDHLLDLLPLVANPDLERQVTRSVEFLAAMAGEGEGLRRYFLRDEGRWESESPLRDHALVARVLQKASRRLSEPRFARISQAVVEAAIDRFLDAEKGIFVDPAFAEDDGAEFLMEMNGLLGLTMMRLGEDGFPPRWEVVNPLMTYFSGAGTLLEERLWDASDWEIMEAYVPYLQAIDVWLELRSFGG
ncbi:MAG: DUF255 domain-containing protein [Chromatiales bacterium]|nr:DUF255 domain-containing protein [Chromatiales bacterium]